MASPTANSVGTATVSLSGDSYVDSLLHGVKWGGGLGTGVDLTYSVLSGDSYFISPYTDRDEPGLFSSVDGWSPINSTQETAFVRALQSIADVVDIRFQSVDDSQFTVGEIRIAKSSVIVGSENSAWAYIPGGHPSAGDIWLSTDVFTSSEPVGLGSFGFYTLIHEIGHALGLKHPFESEPGSPTLLDSDYENVFFTVMSYTADLYGEDLVPDRYPSTPMMLDIEALQYLYGSNTSFNPGNTTYTFNESGRYFLTLWDGGGTDTIKYNASSGGEIDLREGYWSSLGQPLEFSNQSGVFQYQVEETVAIASGARIENATGSNGDDRINGNNLSNVLNGGTGDDRLLGFGGNDVLAGGAGADFLRGYAGNDTYTIDGGNEIDTDLADAGVDTVRSTVDYSLGTQQENLSLLGTANLNATGNNGANILTGNSGTNVLNGGAGDDALNGGAGADSLRGGTGNDTYTIDGGNEIDTDLADPGVDTVRSKVDYSLGTQQENLSLLGTANLNATGNNGANILTGNSGTNVLNGGAGDDALNGGAGTDNLRGGTGNDIYTINGANEIAKKLADPGVDTVRSKVDYSLGTQQENLTLLGTANLNATGNNGANILTGNAGANVLKGRQGNDTLSGGAGDDKFVFSAPIDGGDVDLVTDFSNAGQNDLIHLDNDIFSALVTGANSVLSTAEFKVNSTGIAEEADDRIIYNSSTGELYYDADGNGAGAAIKFALLANVPTIDEQDFLVGD